MTHPAQIKDAKNALNYILAGDANVTIRSVNTGARFTFRVSRKDGEDGKTVHFVSVLTGSDNTSAYTYAGLVAGGRFIPAKPVEGKARITADAPSSKAFSWTMGKLSQGILPPALEVFHDGCCSRCGRLLTTPESLEVGLGPHCLTKVAA